ncbi:MAG: 3-phosphoserine/phosphohydroxythreonine transaminase [Pyrinomonadaceae bacterium]
MFGNRRDVTLFRKLALDRRIYNFSAGPAMMPTPVLEKAQAELLSLNGIGMSVMEISHRSNNFEAILEAARLGIRELLSIPQNYHVLFLQGGASLQFSMIPMNFLAAGRRAEYVVTGAWGVKAVTEARKIGNVSVTYDGVDQGYRTTPAQGIVEPASDAAYLHYTSNETIEGVEFKYDLDGGSVRVICDASSNILSKPIDIEKYALIYAGAQKKIGTSGVTVVIIREDLLEEVPREMASLLDYRAIAANGSMANTPNTWGIYLISMVCKWLRSQGGVLAIRERNEAKAKLLYDAIDASDGFYDGHADRASRSVMNVTFRLQNDELGTEFCSEAATLGMDGLAGHRSVGGVRASIYNAFPKEGVETLVDFMRDFSERRG